MYEYVYAGLILGLRPANGYTSLQSNAVSHWLGTNLESALYMPGPGIYVSSDWLSYKSWFQFKTNNIKVRQFFFIYTG